MTEWTLSAEEQRTIFEQKIRPALFPRGPLDGRPTLLILAGQPGAGASRAAGRLASEHVNEMAEVSADNLRAFHPHFLELSRSQSPEAPRLLAEPTAEWLQNTLRHARTSRQSLVLEGAFNSPDAALGVASLFERDGFATRVAVVATPRPESLLATASRYLLDARSGRASRFTSLASHNAGCDRTRALVATLETTPAVDRLTIVGRDGTDLFDAARTGAESFTGASAALAREQSTSMSSQQTMLWLSELRATTDFAVASHSLHRPLTEVLIELHEVALRDVLPRLSLPLASQARPTTEATLARQLVTLRRALPVETRSGDLAAPVISTSQPDRGISR